MKKVTALALILGAVSGQSLADTSISRDAQLKLPTLVVTASREAEAIENTTSAVTVFTREDIDRLQPSTVVELLRQVPGVHVAQSGGRGSAAGLFIRGTKTAQSLILIDGLRVSGAASGEAALHALSVDQIERIEVLRGPRSAIYGADAIGGVVQIFTRRSEGEGLNPRVRIGYGSQQTWERSVGISGGNEDTRFSLNVSSEETDGINRTTATTVPNDDKDAYRNNSLSASLSHRFTDSFNAGVNILDQRGESEYDSGWQGDYPYSKFRITNVGTYADLVVNEYWTTRIEAGYTENHSSDLYDDNSVEDYLDTDRPSVAWLNTIQVSGSQRLQVGADWYEDRLSSNNKYSEDSRWNRGVFLQHHFQSGWFTTEVGARYDDNEAYGDVTTLSGAVTAPIGEANSLTLSYSEAFRAPTFVDLYYPNSGNPDLEPEESQNVELLWRSQLSTGLNLQASLYRNEIDNAIAWDSSRSAPYNIGQAVIEGVEASLDYRGTDWTAQTGLSLLRSKDQETDKDLLRRPRKTAYFSLDRYLGNFVFGGTVLGVSKAYDYGDVRLSGYGLLNLRANWYVTPGVNLALKVDNVFDKDYTDADSYNEEGRTALVSVTWTPVL